MLYRNYHGIKPCLEKHPTIFKKETTAFGQIKTHYWEKENYRNIVHQDAIEGCKIQNGQTIGWRINRGKYMKKQGYPGISWDCLLFPSSRNIIKKHKCIAAPNNNKWIIIKIKPPYKHNIPQACPQRNAACSVTDAYLFIYLVIVDKPNHKELKPASMLF